MQVLGEVLITILVIAAIVEHLWQWLKEIFAPWIRWLDNHNVPADRLGALLVSCVICFAVGDRIDLFVLLGIPLKIGWIGIAATAIAVSRGSNAVHDLFDKLGNSREQQKLATEQYKHYSNAGM